MTLINDFDSFINEAKGNPKKYKQFWDKGPETQIRRKFGKDYEKAINNRVNLLLTLVDDPDKAEEYAEMDFLSLPNGIATQLVNMNPKEIDVILDDAITMNQMRGESVDEGPDYDEAKFQLDKIFGDDQESIETFQDIEDNGTVKDMIEYIDTYGDEDQLQSYGIRSSAHVKKLAQKIMKESNSITEAEDYKYKKYVSKAFDKIQDEMFAFRNAMGVKQSAQADPKIKNTLEELHKKLVYLKETMKNKGLTESVNEAKFVKDYDKKVLDAETEKEILKVYPKAKFFVGKFSHFFGELEPNLFFKAYYKDYVAKPKVKEFLIVSIYSKKGSNYEYLYERSDKDWSMAKESINEASRSWNDIAKLITKAWKGANIPTSYAKDYAASLERMAKKNAKLFFKQYGDFTEEDFVEDMEYNMANESVNEASDKDKPYFDFLLALRDSGATNMFGAAPYLQSEFGMSKSEARKVLTKWMKSFNESVNEAKVTGKTIDGLTNKLAKTVKELKDNYEMYKKAKTDSDKKKWTKRAGELTKLKQLVDSELEQAIQSFHKDVEYDEAYESLLHHESLLESTIGIKTSGSAEVKYLDAIKKKLDKAKIKYKFNRLSMTLSVLDMDKKDFAEAKKIVDDSELTIMMAKESLNEGKFGDWEVSFKPMNLSGTKLNPKNVYKVKARGTAEAIKKAAKDAGVKDDMWIATETNFVKKLN